MLGDAMKEVIVGGKRPTNTGKHTNSFAGSKWCKSSKDNYTKHSPPSEKQTPLASKFPWRHPGANTTDTFKILFPLFWEEGWFAFLAPLHNSEALAICPQLVRVTGNNLRTSLSAFVRGIKGHFQGSNSQGIFSLVTGPLPFSLPIPASSSTQGSLLL